MIFTWTFQKIYRWFRPTVVKGVNNSITIGSPRQNFVIRIHGDNNSIDIGKGCRLKNTQIELTGNNNHIIVENGTKFDGPCKILLEGNATLYIGSNSGIRGVSFVIRDGRISVGCNCMFGFSIMLRNFDGHKVLDNEGNVTNPPCDVVIEDHVWLCERCSILKGVTIGADSVVAYGAVVTKDCPKNSIVAGNPARVVKQNINWLNK